MVPALIGSVQAFLPLRTENIYDYPFNAGTNKGTFVWTNVISCISRFSIVFYFFFDIKN